MTALSAARKAPKYGAGPVPVRFKVPLQADAVVFQGGLVCVDTNDENLGVPGATSTTLLPAGIALDSVNNTGGADSAAFVEVEAGAYVFENSADTDEIGPEHLFSLVFIVDDQTAAATDGTASRSVLGTVVGFDGAKPIVFVNPLAQRITVEVPE